MSRRRWRLLAGALVAAVLVLAIGLQLRRDGATLLAGLRTGWQLDPRPLAAAWLVQTAGWLLTEMGRQPWIVQGLLLTSEANSPNVSTTWLGISLGVFISLYVVLGVVDFVLMRRYANPRREARREELPEAVLTY